MKPPGRHEASGDGQPRLDDQAEGEHPDRPDDAAADASDADAGTVEDDTDVELDAGTAGGPRAEETVASSAGQPDAAPVGGRPEADPAGARAPMATRVGSEEALPGTGGAGSDATSGAQGQPDAQGQPEGEGQPEGQGQAAGQGQPAEQGGRPGAGGPDEASGSEGLTGASNGTRDPGPRSRDRQPTPASGTAARLDGDDGDESPGRPAGDVRHESDDHAPVGDVPSLYVRALRLRYVAPTGWRRGLVAEGSVVLALFIALADLASAWVVVALPIAAAAAVKYNDLIAGLLGRSGGGGGEESDS